MTNVAVVLHDDERTLGVIETLLSGEGLEVRGAQGPYDVLALATPREADTDPERVALVLLGLSALEPRDLELVGLLRDRCPAALILLLFPASLRDRASVALALGADASLPEPFYPAEIVSYARSALERLTRPPAEAVPPDPLPTPERGEEGVAQLAAGVAHSIRNPLQILELMLGNVEIGDPLDVAKTKHELRRLAQVADGLARFGAGAQGEPRPLDLNAMVSRTFDSRLRPGRPVVALSLTAEDVTVMLPPEALQTALDILRARAERVTPSSGTISVSTRVTATRPTPVVELAVSDGGQRLSPRRLERLFDPYPDPDAPHEAAWLELAAFAGIVRSAGGNVEAAEQGPAGTTIRISLPLHRSTPERLPSGAGRPA